MGKTPILNGYENSQVFSCVGKLWETEEGTAHRLWEMRSLEVTRAVNKIMWLIPVSSVNPNGRSFTLPWRDGARTEEPSVTAVVISCSLIRLCNIRTIPMLPLYRVWINIWCRRTGSGSAKSAGFFGGWGKEKKRRGENLEDGHVTRQQPSGDAELRSSLKFSGSERLADDWWKKMCVPIQDKPR